MSNEEEEHPLNCYSSIGDGYSGWYAVSNPNRCTDFCYWELLITHDNSTSDNTRFTKENTANPHETTLLPGKSQWKCLLNAAQDETTWSSANSNNNNEEENVAVVYPGGNNNKYYGDTFDYLRCNRNANEYIETMGGRVNHSELYWWFWLFLCIFGWILEFFYIKRRRREWSWDKNGNSATTRSDSRMELIPLPQEEEEDEEEMNVGEEGEEQTLTQESSHEMAMPKSSDGERCSRLWSWFPPCMKKCLIIILFLLLNGTLVAIMIISIMSLVELNGIYPSSTISMSLTPFCSNPNTVCPLANTDIDRPSKQSPQQLPSLSDTSSFSYLLASDAQLNWYDGESAYLGKRNTPIPCSTSDSCSECTAKFGMYTNNQIKIAMEHLINGDYHNNINNNVATATDTDNTRTAIRHDGRSNSSSFQTPPQTLVMNGDLTAYFHPHEHMRYESIYHHLPPKLTSYFPSLGNHDYDHGGSAHYNIDKWNWGPKDCNAMHSISYLKGGFCGKIPNFSPSRIHSYDSDSLAYSWNEGVYHFIHLHYYPAFENAALDLKSSVQWLNRDLSMAKSDGYATILFVHAAQGLTVDLERVFVNQNIKAIFAGHSHRCFFRKCVGLRAINERQANDTNILERAHKCIPGTLDRCGGFTGMGDMSLFYVHDKDEALILPETKLFNEFPSKKTRTEKKNLCGEPIPIYVNDTDNTLLCVKAIHSHPYFPFPNDGDGDDENEDAENSASDRNMEKIPIFWSGSVSFETFLHVDFHPDKFVVNAMTAMEGVEGQRYVDVNDVPNAVYPYHNRSDLEEVIIYI